MLIGHVNGHQTIWTSKLIASQCTIALFIKCMFRLHLLINYHWVSLPQEEADHCKNYPDRLSTGISKCKSLLLEFGEVPHANARQLFILIPLSREWKLSKWIYVDKLYCKYMDYISLVHALLTQYMHYYFFSDEWINKRKPLVYLHSIYLFPFMTAFP